MSLEQTPGRDGDPPDALGLDSGIAALQSSPEFRGPVERLDRETCNDHLAHIYEEKAELVATSVPFLRQGLERGERCMFVIDTLEERAVLGALRDAGVDADAAVESGALTFHTVEETYLRNGEFDPDEMLEFYGGAIEEATEEYAALRVVAETSWLQVESTSVADFMEYESKVNRLFEGADCIALCHYDRTAFSPEEVRDILQTHPHLIYDGAVCHNFYYTPPAEFFEPDRPAREVDRMMGTLVERTEAKVELQNRERFLREMYAVTSDGERSFVEKVERLLDLGREFFDLEIGYFAVTDPDRDHFEVVEAVGSHERIQAGVSDDLAGTYCQKVLDAGESVSVTDAVEEGWENDPAYDTFGLDAYLGTRLAVNGEVYGTLCFGSPEPRTEPFTHAEHTFLDLISQWVSYELERTERERDLRELYEVTADQDLAFEEKVERVLELGTERFGLDQGYLARFHPEEELFENEFVVGPPDQDLREGVPSAQPGPGRFCRRTVEMHAPRGAPDVREGGWDDDPVHRESGLASYFGVGVSDGAGPYGTLAFCDTSARDRPFDDAERTFLELMGQWVSHALEQRRRETQLAAVNEMSRDLMDAESFDAIAETTVEYATGPLELPVAAVVEYTDEGTLSPVARTPRAGAELPTRALCATAEGPAWEAFVAGESRVVDGDEALAATDLAEVVAVPLQQRGVFLTGTAASCGFTPTEREFVETAAATVEAACARADRERRLHERETTLEEQNEALERLNRVNGIIRDIDQGLVQATTREEIEAVVCEKLADVGPYELAWVGDHDPATGEVVPTEWAGSESDYLEAVTIRADDSPKGRGPTGRAVRTREPQVVNNVLEDGSYEPWRQDALNRGYHASIALPLVYGGTLYGVLNVYAGRPGVFDDLERSVLTELSATIAHAINAVESKKALVSSEVTELTFGLDPADVNLVGIVREVGAELEMETVLPGTEGALRGFYTVRGVTAEEAFTFESQLPVSDLTLVSEHEEDGRPVCLFEAELTLGSLAALAVEHGGRPRELSITGEEATFTVELGAEADVREFVETVRARLPNADLLAQRSHERPHRTPAEVRAAVVEDLTDRQLEVLRTAYFSGYFETPRTNTGSEVADTLDIAQPTFNSHVRAAQRKLCRRLFEAE